MTRNQQLTLVALGALAFAAVTTTLLDAASREPNAPSLAVPPGAIIGWLPPEGTTAIPEGWLICSRANQIKYPWIPDLTTHGSFLRAAQNPHPVSELYDGGQRGGSATHSHQTARRTVDNRRLERRSSGDRAATEGHTHVTEAESHLPPHVNVVFLCKCRTTDCSQG